MIGLALAAFSLIFGLAAIQKRIRRFGWPLSVILPSERRARREGLLDWWPDQPPISGV